MNRSELLEISPPQRKISEGNLITRVLAKSMDESHSLYNVLSFKVVALYFELGTVASFGLSLHGEPKLATVPINAINSCKSCGAPDKANLIKLITLKSVSIYIQTRTHVNNNTYLYLLPQIILPMQFYITGTQILDWNYPLSKICYPIMSVIFGKALYLILQKMPPERFARFRGYHAYIRLIDY